jgi:ribonuclease P protein component
VHRLSFRKHEHLRRGADFARVYALRCVARTAHLTVFAAPNQTDALRVGLSVSRKNGNAVARNRLKRLLREAFRLSRHEMPGGLDLVLVPVDARNVKLKDLQEALVRAVQNLARKLKREADASPDGQKNGGQKNGIDGTRRSPSGAKSRTPDPRENG